MGVGRIYSIQRGGGQKGGRDIFKIQGELAKRGELKEFRGVWTLDEAMKYSTHVKLFSVKGEYLFRCYYVN